MKTISVKFIIILATVLILSGCSVPKSSFVVSVPSNTQIEWWDQKRADNDVKITTYANEYVGLLVAKDPVSGLRVPFGVDYKHKIYHGDGIKAGFGTLATLTGGVATIVGVAFGKEEGMENEALSLALPGMAAFGGGLPVAISGFKRQNLLSHDYKFTYVPVQRVTFDGISSTLAHVDPPKNASTYVASNAPKSPWSSYNSTQSPSKSTVEKNSQSKDLADLVSGKYTGSLKFMEGEEVLESYSRVVVELSKIDSSKVRMTVTLRGENFFNNDGDDPQVATINPEKNGGYNLKWLKFPDAVLKIDKSNNLRLTQNIIGSNGERVVVSFSGKK